MAILYEILGFPLKNEISLGDLIQSAGFIAAVLAVVIESWRYRKGQRDAIEQRKKDDRDAFEARKIEIYQRLEIESNRVFEFEARHPELVPEMKRRLAPPSGIEGMIVRDEYKEKMEPRQIAMIARKYYEMNCNLFEIAARLRKNRLIDDDVFGSWVAWYFDTCTEWGFRALWADLRDNYTADLRAIFDPLCGTLVTAWDKPHADGTLGVGAMIDGVPDVTSDELEARREEFYRDVASTIGNERKDGPCLVILGWLTKVKESPLPAEHPLAYS